MRIFILLIAVSLSALSTSEVYAQSKKKKRKISAVIKHAKSYVGTPYRYGGTNKKGIDCSALIQNSFSSAGYRIPRTAKEQSKFGKKVGWGSVRVGDIVFFKFKSKGSKWYHSGLITRVNGDDIRFVHASSSKGVVESSLKSDYYKKNVKNFRRVVK